VSAMSMCDATRNDRQVVLATCPMCCRTLPREGRHIYCGPACRQRAFRLRRRQLHRSTLTDIGNRLRRQQRLIAQTVYECPSCQQRLLGSRRCPECNLMCRKLGLGGECGNCAEILTVAELLDLDLDGGDAVA